MRKWFLAGFLLGLLGLVAARRERNAVRAFFANPVMPGKMVDLGGYRVYVHSQGEKQPGQPTVVLLSGHGDWSHCWRKVAPEIARFARVVAYDRPGFGWSDPGPYPRTPEKLVSELHRTLEAAGESGPYLLVGHSMGAALSRLFHRRYPGEVQGMVWVDSGHEKMGSFLPFWRPAYTGFVSLIQLGTGLAHLGLIRRFGARYIVANYPSAPEEYAELAGQTVSARFFRTLTDETIQMANPANWDEGPQPLGEMPVIAIEAKYSTAALPGVPAKGWEVFLTGWQAMHTDLRRLSSNLRWIPAESGHNVMNEQPDLVIQAVREMLAKLATAS
jgi:pimeloyl-ACP methyl ester carboxylesterase